jgi:hypothetical protein
MIMRDELIPKQEKGGQLDVYSDTALESLGDATHFFEVVKTRLLDINLWDEVCKAPSATFRLINNKNQEIIGLAKEGDYIRINIPGPGTKTGEGFDWVRIESITVQKAESTELLSITVRPCNHPLKPKYLIAHFFTERASSTFQIKRMNNKIYAAVHGRNELINNKVGNLLDRIRNTLVGLGAKLGISYPQWKLLVEGLVRS